MSFIRSRMRRLEQRSRSVVRCPECGQTLDGRGRIVYADELEPDEPRHCARCGGSLYFIIEIAEAGAGKPFVEFVPGGGGGT